MDHDSKFKVMIKDRFSDLIAMFAPHLHSQFDFDQIEWLNKEVFVDPPLNTKYRLDLIAKVKVKQATNSTQESQSSEKWFAIIFVETESGDSVTSIKNRLFQYYFLVWLEYKMLIFPIVLFLNMNKDGIHRDKVEHVFFDEIVMTLNYLGIGLRGLDAVEYLEKDFPLGYGLASLMKQTQAPFEIAKQAAQKIRGSDVNDRTKDLLGDCLLSYCDLNEEQMQEVYVKLKLEPTPKLIPRNVTIFQRIEDAEERARCTQLCSSIQTLLSSRFNVTTVEELMGLIQPVTDISKLESIFKAGISDSLEDFRKKLT